MGTRADFYVGRDAGAQWIGSIAYDGYLSAMPLSILTATSEAAFRQAVAAFLASRDDATQPAQGWPWPWKTSETTDCSYWWFDGRTWDDWDSRYRACGEPPITYPVHDTGQYAAAGSPRSGINVLFIPKA